MDRTIMKTRFSILLAIATLIPMSGIRAADGIRFETSSGITFVPTASGILENWTDGWTVGIAAAYPISPNFELGPVVAFSRLSYHADGNLGLVFPAIVGFQWHVDGKPTNVYEVAVESRFIASGSSLQPFMTFRGGVYIIHLGDILTTTNIRGDYTSTSLYRGSGETLSKSFLGFGFGLAFPLDSNFYFKVESRYAGTFDGSLELIPVLASMQFIF